MDVNFQVLGRKFPSTWKEYFQVLEKIFPSTWKNIFKYLEIYVQILGILSALRMSLIFSALGLDFGCRLNGGFFRCFGIRGVGMGENGGDGRSVSGWQAVVTGGK